MATVTDERNEELLGSHRFARVDQWFCEALFGEEPLRAAAAESNLRRAIRRPEGRDAVLIAIGQMRTLTELELPRLWQLRQQLRTPSSHGTVTAALPLAAPSPVPGL